MKMFNCYVSAHYGVRYELRPQWNHLNILSIQGPIQLSQGIHSTSLHEISNYAVTVPTWWNKKSTCLKQVAWVSPSALKLDF